MPSAVYYISSGLLLLQLQAVFGITAWFPQQQQDALANYSNTPLEIHYEYNVTVVNATSGDVLNALISTCTVQVSPYTRTFGDVDTVQEYIQAALQECPDHFFQTFYSILNEGPPSSAEEYDKRKQIWSDNLQFIFDSNNQETPLGLVPNAWATQTLEESIKYSSGLPDMSLLSPQDRNLRRKLQALIPLNQLPANFDWRDHGLPLRSRDQGGCNACYAFTATSLIESLVYMGTEIQGSYSPQDIMQCCSIQNCWWGNLACPPGTICGPCVAGWPHLALQWAALWGLQAYDNNPYNPLPYVEWNGVSPPLTSCFTRTYPQNVANLVAYNASTGYMTLFSELQLINLLMQSPVIIGMNNMDNVFRFAGPTHTVLTPSAPLNSINHAVLLVGYGVHPVTQQKYWLILNSYGNKWGDNGFARILRSDSDPWNVLMYVAVATVENTAIQCLVPYCGACDTSRSFQPFLHCKSCVAGYVLGQNDVGYWVCSPAA